MYVAYSSLMSASRPIEMPKEGKPDSYWAGVMVRFAQGKHKFSIGQRPGGRRWRAVIERIKNCPLTPIFGLAVRKFDIFGKKIPCKCGYHDVSIVIESLNI